MFTKLLKLMVYSLFATSLYATDMNNTATIIQEARQATQPIQEELTILLEENTTQSIEEEVQERVIATTVEEKPMAGQLVKIPAEITLTTVIETNSTTLPTETDINDSIPNQIVSQEPLPVETTQIIPIENKPNTLQQDIENNESNEEKKLNLTKGNSLKGKDIFIKQMKEKCETTGYKFAGNYAQEEWEEIAESGKFHETIFKLCPNIKEEYNEKWSTDLYQFFYEHASDSENIPEC